MMKILSIGNSFSVDAHHYLNRLAIANGTELECYNLYIGGCSLETHWNNVTEDNPTYVLYKNGIETEDMISIHTALTADKYDAVTLQQASHYSGMPQTYIPYITKLADLVREKQPQARLYFHRTWAYELDAEHPAFPNYNCDQQEMNRRISDCTEMAARLINAEVIPVGAVIQRLRDTVPEFDYKNEGLSLCRDGFHLSWDYGRFAAAATWFKVLTGKTPEISKFNELDSTLLSKITAVIAETVK